MKPFELSQSVDPDKIFLINRSELAGRLDPIYYQAVLHNILKSSRYPISALKHITLSMRSGTGAGKQDQEQEANIGIIQIRPTNIDKEGQLIFGKCIYLPQTKLGLLETINVNDVLFNNTNSQELVGKTAILKEKKTLFFSNHITKIEVNTKKIIPDYLWIILNLYQQKRVFYSICTNWNNQSGVGIDLLQSLKIPVPPLNQQENIISFFHQANTRKQQKQQQASALLASIDSYLLNELGIILPEQDNSLANRMFLVSSRKVSGDRLDADFYKKFYLNSLLAISSKIPTIKLKQIATIFQGVGKNETALSECILLKVKNIKQHNEIDFTDTEFVSDVPINKILQPFDIISPFIGEAIRQYKFANFPNILNKYTVDNNTGVIRVNNNNNPIYICEILNSSIAKFQIDRLLGGGGVPFLGTKGAKEITIPLPPLKKQQEIVTHIEQIRTKAKQLQQEAEQLLTEAKATVEQMILGQD